MRHMLTVVVLAATLAGCGTPSYGPAAAPQSGAMAALKQEADASFEAGQAAGMIRSAAIHQQKTSVKAPRLRQGDIEPASYDLGYAVGLLAGSINAFKNIDGSFDVRQWKSFAEMNYQAMKEAQRALESNDALRAKHGVALGILKGGIRHYESLSGSYDVRQWKSFAYGNLEVMESALAELKK